MTTQTDPFSDFVKALNTAAASLASIGRNVMIKLAGGYTDNEYADAMMREHQNALIKQGKGRRGYVSIPELPKLARGGTIHGSDVTESRMFMILPTKNGDRS